MLILDLFLLTFTLAALVAISAARMGGKLPHRGFPRVTQGQSPRAARAASASPNDAAKPDNFRGVLSHFDGPVRFHQPSHTS